MSGSAKEWIFVALFFAMLFGVSIVDIFWLAKRNGIDLRRALIAVFVPNFLTITIGFLFTFIVFGILFAVAWDENTEMPGGEAGTWALLSLGILFPLFLMTGVKYLLVRILKLSSISKRFTSPFSYSLLSSILFFLVVVGLPCLLLFLF